MAENFLSGPAPSDFAEIRALVRVLKGPDLAAEAAAAKRNADLLKPAGALGRLETLAQWLAAWQGQHPPRMRHPRVALFAGNHGIAAPADGRGVSAWPQSVTADIVAACVNGRAAINQICETIDADLRVYELALEQPTEDFRSSHAMSEADCVRAIAYGMMAVEPGLDVLCLGEIGIGNTAVASALLALLLGGGATDWVGPGAGATVDQLAHKTAIVDAGLEFHRRTWKGDPLDALARVGGYEFAAIVGAILAARMARTPVVLDGFACTAAAAVVHAIDNQGLAHCIAAHRSAEPAHGRALAALNLRPLLDLDMRLGEGSGAALAVPLLKAAAACHAGMATFADLALTRADGL